MLFRAKDGLAGSDIWRQTVCDSRCGGTIQARKSLGHLKDRRHTGAEEEGGCERGFASAKSNCAYFPSE
jgi:hypothetical protein